ncbi:MAG TPA: hypothetical protein VFI59_09730 [Actinomycetota bacterium]|nr:hypothetical protein [Actinomycetota bacterium]
MPLMVVALALTIAVGMWFTGRAQQPRTEDAVGTGYFPDVPSPTSAVLPSPAPTDAGLVGQPGIGRQVLTVGDVPLSLRMPAPGWERFAGVSLNKSVVGPQGAEAMLYWSSFPEGGRAEPCADLLGQSVSGSVTDLVRAVATAPGTRLVAGPSTVTVGGRPADRVVLTVRERNGCNPGFFFTWRDIRGGALFPRTTAGDRIEVWIVDVSGSRLFIAAVTTEQADRALRRESRQIVGSIRFIPPHVLADVKIAERFMQARNDNDVATAMSLLSKDGATAWMQNGYRTERNMPFVRLDREELALALEVERLYEVRYTASGCRWDSDPVIRGAPIVCTYRMDNTLRRILGYPPVESSISIGVGQDRITHLSFPWLNVSYPSADPPEFAEFVAWIGAEHPEAGQVNDDGELFKTGGQELVHTLSRTSIDLLATYLGEYERSMTS